MKCFRNSENFIWNTTLTLGRGASGTVYQGVHERTGEKVAVKTFNSKINLHPLEIHRIQMKEFEMMRNLDHENIVKVIAIEEEVQSHRKVLVLEFCNAGSLFTYLLEPQNSYGLEDEEFLLVPKAISAGMKYLRDKDIPIIHRDMKPGNIMRHIQEDGSTIYKIADFGSARPLPEDEGFISLHGTPEYLHPDMYEVAVLKRPGVKVFGSNVDLWSIGTTLYQVATGSLPIQPFGGRTNKETWHFIMINKDPGVISGIQRSRNGPIEWSRKLPEASLLSPELRNSVTVLVAGLLENGEDQWTYDKFFEYANDITSRKVFHVFYMNEMREIKLYMQPHQTLQDMKENILAQTNVPCSRQLLLFDKSLFNPSLDVSSFPSTTVNQPLILIDVESADVKDCISASFPTLTSSITPNSAIDMAKTCCTNAYSLKRFIVKLIRCQELLLRIPNTLLFLAENSNRKLVSSSDILQEKIKDLNHRINIAERSYSFLSKSVSTFLNGQDYNNEFQKISLIVSENKNSINQLTKQVAETNQSLLNNTVLVSKLQTDWEDALPNCSALTGCIEKANTYIGILCDSCKTFRNQQNVARPAIIQKLEELEMKKNINKLNLLKEDCLQSCLEVSKKLVQWYKRMRDLTIKTHLLDKDLTSASDNLKRYTSFLQKAEFEICKMEEILVPFQKKACANKELSQIVVLQQENKDLSEIIGKQASLMEQLDLLNSLLKCDINDSNEKEDKL